MATLHFDGAGTNIGEMTPISTALSGASNGAWTVATLMTMEEYTGWRLAAGVTNSARNNRYLNVGNNSDAGGGALAVDITGGSCHSTTMIQVNSSTIWYLMVATRPAGTSQTVRFHWKDITTPGTLTHENASVANSTSNAAGPGTSGIMQIGGVTNGGEWWQGSVGLVGVWTVNMSDADVAALLTNLKTSDWYNHSAGTPVFLSETKSATPTDLISSASISVATPSLTGPEPTGWTFDGVGGGAPIDISVIN